MDYYHKLANEIIKIPSGVFERVVMSARVGDDFSDIQYDAVVDGVEKKGIPGNAQVTNNVDDILHEMRKGWPGGPWSGCKFTLNSSGDFNFETSYDDQVNK